MAGNRIHLLSRMSLSARPLNSWDMVKILALLLMFIDHAGYFLFTDQHYWMRAIGRGAAPIFFFLTGYASRYRFRWDLLLLGLLMIAVSFYLAGYMRPLNILIPILLYRLFFGWLEKRGKSIRRPYDWFIGAVLLFPTYTVVEYGSSGFLFALCGYLYRREAQYSLTTRRIMLGLTCIFHGILQILLFDPPISITLTVLTLATIGFLLSVLHVTEIEAVKRLPRSVKQPLKMLSYTSAYIYALHVMALELLTGLPM